MASQPSIHGKWKPFAFSKIIYRWLCKSKNHSSSVIFLTTLFHTDNDRSTSLLSLQIRPTCSDNSSCVTSNTRNAQNFENLNFIHLRNTFMNVGKVGVKQITRNLLLWSKRVYLVLTKLSTAENSESIFLKWPWLWIFRFDPPNEGATSTSWNLLQAAIFAKQRLMSIQSVCYIQKYSIFIRLVNTHDETFIP